MKIDMGNLNGIKPLRGGAASAQQQIDDAKEVRDTFRKFVGEAFFGQMLKAMRSTQGKPAYFHGGQGEEVFQSQLDQVMSEKMTEASADTLAAPMFAQQFPKQAGILARGENKSMLTLNDLGPLRRM
ncbi:MAG: rod-binding protein [Bythopirellula sp.]|nr:rod-binding protein [Bythopirellula sp.]